MCILGQGSSFYEQLLLINRYVQNLWVRGSDVQIPGTFLFLPTDTNRLVAMQMHANTTS